MRIRYAVVKGGAGDLLLQLDFSRAISTQRVEDIGPHGFAGRLVNLANLTAWRARLAESIRRRIENSGRWLGRLQAMYAAEGAGDAGSGLVGPEAFDQVVEDVLRLGSSSARMASGW